jgi:hypothetical protein
MKPKKIPKLAKNDQLADDIPMSLHALSVALGIPRPTVRNLLKDVVPVAQSRGGGARWTLRQCQEAMEKQDGQPTGTAVVSMAEAKRLREIETLRKLKLANDARAGTLIDRRWVTGQLSALCSRWHAIRLAIEIELPLAIQGKGIPECRQIVKAELAKLGVAFAELSKTIEQEPKT